MYYSLRYFGSEYSLGFLNQKWLRKVLFTSQKFIYLVQLMSKTPADKYPQYSIKIASTRRSRDTSAKQLGINILKANDCKR